MAICCPLTSIDDYERYENYTEEIRTDGVEHKCCECSSVIPPGEKFEICSGDFGGEHMVHETCMVCTEIGDHFACGDGRYIGQLWEDLEMNFFPDMRMGGPCMKGLSPAAKSALVEARLEWVLSGVETIRVALPPWWRWWYGDDATDDGEGAY